MFGVWGGGGGGGVIGEVILGDIGYWAHLVGYEVDHIAERS